MKIFHNLFTFLFLMNIKHINANIKTCDNCVCDCSWSNDITCGNNDGTCCYSCCCNNNINSDSHCADLYQQCGGQEWNGVKCCKNPYVCEYINNWYHQCRESNIIQTYSSSSTHNDTNYNNNCSNNNTELKKFCPDIKDFKFAYGSNINVFKQGWTFTGGNGIATKSSFNILGGYIEYDIDFSKSNTGVNGNIYCIFPNLSDKINGYQTTDYCDAQKTGDNWCPEIDWVESNGKCGGQTTYHTIEGTGYGCTAWGCYGTFKYSNENLKFHMKIFYDTNGVITTYRNSQLITITPTPLTSDWNIVKEYSEKRGMVIYSSNWQGWVPMNTECGSWQNLDTSSFTVSNLVIYGKISQGPDTSLC